MAPVGVIIIVDKNQEVRRMSNATTVARNGILRKCVGTVKREERVKILSHQMLKGV